MRHMYRELVPPRRQYAGYYQSGDYSELQRCCFVPHRSWQAAREHAESKACVGSNIIVREYFQGCWKTVYTGRKS